MKCSESKFHNIFQLIMNPHYCQPKLWFLNNLLFVYHFICTNDTFFKNWYFSFKISPAKAKNCLFFIFCLAKSFYFEWKTDKISNFRLAGLILKKKISIFKERMAICMNVIFLSSTFELLTKNFFSLILDNILDVWLRFWRLLRISD